LDLIMADSAQRVHSTAVISEEAQIATDVIIGRHVIIEGQVRIGSGCVLHHRAHLCGPLTLGERNQVFTGVILGERPQHRTYQDEPTSVEIGDDNVFRENVTIHRATTHSWTTRIGNRNLFMAGSHVGHDSQIGDGCILADRALIAGHCLLEDNVYVGANSAVHQFVRMGTLARLNLGSVMTQDLPPFVRASEFNTVTGVNVAGMRQAGHTECEITAIGRACFILYEESNPLALALKKIAQEFRNIGVINTLLEFIRQSKRGVVFGTKHFCRDADAAGKESLPPAAAEPALGPTRSAAA
jgi:UDP-N-acetylglucosamine acyltransferase